MGYSAATACGVVWLRAAAAAAMLRCAALWLSCRATRCEPRGAVAGGFWVLRVRGGKQQGGRL
eukprot:2752757-Alexandrium_andersonii.AAC.1